MAKGLALTAGVLAASLTGCSPFGGGAAFTCTDSEQCNLQGPGRCEPNGFCSYTDTNCASGQIYGDNSGGLSGICVGDEPPPDGGTDGGNKTCYGAMNGLVRPCFRPAPTGDVMLTTAINTTNDARCSRDVTDVPAGLCVIAGATITVPAGATIEVTGDKPLVLVATDSIRITGTLDAASHRSTTSPDMHGQAGAGSDPTDGCAPGNLPGISGGGAGGSFIALGGTGGAGTGAGGQPGTARALALRGGCRGQDAQGTGLMALGGRGGGAVYLIATTITIEGTINASGEGGHRGISPGDSPGGGGGSGGLIGLDAMTIDNTNGTVFANGGGGGEGSGNGASGNHGADPNSVAPAIGGTGGGGGNGGAGGAGGTGGGNATGGNGQSAAGNGGGGGGGAAGVIKVYRGTLDGQFSPMPTP